MIEEQTNLVSSRPKHVTKEEILAELGIQNKDKLVTFIKENNHPLYSFEKQDDHRWGIVSYKVHKRGSPNYDFFLTIDEDEES